MRADKARAWLAQHTQIKWRLREDTLGWQLESSVMTISGHSDSANLRAYLRFPKVGTEAGYRSILIYQSEDLADLCETVRRAVVQHRHDLVACEGLAIDSVLDRVRLDTRPMLDVLRKNRLPANTAASLISIYRDGAAARVSARVHECLVDRGILHDDGRGLTSYGLDVARSLQELAPC